MLKVDLWLNKFVLYKDDANCYMGNGLGTSENIENQKRTIVVILARNDGELICDASS